MFEVTADDLPEIYSCYRIRKHMVYKQQELLVKAMEDDTELYTKRSHTPEGRTMYKQKWQALATRLNSVDGGAMKNILEWQKAWTTFKSHVKTKASTLRSQTRGTSEGPRRHRILTLLEERVVNLMGHETVCGLPIIEAGFGAILDVGTEPEVDPLAIFDPSEGSSPAIPNREKMPTDYNVIPSALLGTPSSSRSVTPEISEESEGPPPSKKKRKTTNRGPENTTQELQTAIASFSKIMVRQAEAMEAVANALQQMHPLLQTIATAAETLTNANANFNIKHDYSDDA